jgi:hypothetical protein
MHLCACRKIHAAKRRLWEHDNQVLGRIVTTSVRTMKPALNLSDTGVTTADDIDDGNDGSRKAVFATVSEEVDAEQAAAAAVWAARSRAPRMP